MQTKDFNLVHHPWIAALYMNGTTKYIGLKQLFQDWNDIACINGTNTKHTLAINRLLQLILMKATGGFNSLKGFKELWNNESLGVVVADYLETHAKRFCLGCDDNPFLQSPIVGKYIIPEQFNAFAVAGVGNKDLTMVCNGTLVKPPTYTPMEIAQFLLAQNFLGRAGAGDVPNTTLLKPTGIDMRSHFNGSSSALYYNSTSVSIAGNNLRETLLLNLPKEKLNGSEVAPWDRERDLMPSEVVPSTSFEALSILTRSVLLLWDANGELSGVYAGVGDKISPEVKNLLPELGLLQAFPTVKTKDDSIIFPSPSKNQPLWKDISLIFSLSTEGAKSNIYPAPIVGWWEKLAYEGVLPDNVSYEVTHVVSMGKNGGKAEKAQGVIAAVTTNSIMLPHSIFTDSSTGKYLFAIFKLITDLNRTLFLVNTGGGADKENIKSSPLALLRKYAKLFTKSQNWALQMLSKYPVGQQFLGLAELIFMEAVAEASSNPEGFSQHVNAYQEQILALARTVWAGTINSIPLATPRYFLAAGHANSQFQRTIHFYKKPIVGTTNAN